MSSIWIGVITTVIGGILGASTAISASLVNGEQQKRLKTMEYERLDVGVRAQLMALLRAVGSYVEFCCTYGVTDWERMNVPWARLVDRIYERDVTVALTPEESRALYDAADAIELAYLFTLKWPWGKQTDDKSDEKPEPFDPFDANEKVKWTFQKSAARIGEFFALMGDDVQAKRFEVASKKVGAPKSGVQ